jgi:hypothetical protein
MKVLIFDTWMAPYHVGTALEIAETHIAQGDRVQYVNISASLPFIEVHHRRKYSQHWVLRKKYRNIVAMCKKGGIPCSFKTGVSPFFTFRLPDTIKTATDLRNWHYEDMDLGISILSSLISQTRDAEPELKRYQHLLSLIATSCLKTLASFTYWCNEFKPDRVYFVNGRTAITRPILRYCEKMGIDFRTHERGGNENVNSYSIHTTFLHDLASYNQLIEKHWNEAMQSDIEKIAIANQFYERLRSGKKQWIAFNDLMEKGVLPNGFNPHQNNVVYFTSSITEFSAIDANNTETLFPNQYDSVRFIANVLAEMPNTVFYLRLHPNTKKSFPIEYKRWLEFVDEMGKKIQWIDGDSGVDSYTLMMMANKIVVSYSTVGIEAPVYDKPVIAVQNARYHKLGSTYFPKSEHELRALLQDTQLAPLPKIGSYKFAYFQMTWGIPFKNYEPSSRFLGRYRGMDLDAVSLGFFDRAVMYLLDRFKIKNL